MAGAGPDPPVHHPLQQRATPGNTVSTKAAATRNYGQEHGTEQKEKDEGTLVGARTRVLKLNVAPKPSYLDRRHVFSFEQKNIKLHPAHSRETYGTRHATRKDFRLTVTTLSLSYHVAQEIAPHIRGVKTKKTRRQKHTYFRCLRQNMLICFVLVYMFLLMTRLSPSCEYTT